MSKYISEADFMITFYRIYASEHWRKLVRGMLHRIVAEAPSIDIVFCRECKNCSKGWVYAQRADGSEIIVNECRHYKPPMNVELDHYCSYGERRGRVNGF